MESVNASIRSQMLARIAQARVSAAPLERIPASPSERSRNEIVEQFAEYAAEYRATVVRISQAEVPQKVAEMIRLRESERVVIPADLPREWVPTGIVDSGFDHRELATMRGVVTGCAVAIAETGTVVLDAGPGQGRRALTLIPDHHICVVFESQVVDSVAEAVERLGESVRARRPLTWISGPSATSDIELSRVEGVHGPRILDILLVSEDA